MKLNLDELRGDMIDLIESGASPHEIIDELCNAIEEVQSSDTKTTKWQYQIDILDTLPAALDINYKSEYVITEMLSGMNKMISELNVLYAKKAEESINFWNQRVNELNEEVRNEV